MEILETIGRELVSFLIGPKGISVLLLVALLVHIRKYLAAVFCFISIGYIVGLATLSRALTIEMFPVNLFLLYLGAGLLLVGTMGYLLFIRTPAPPYKPSDKEHESSVVADGNDFRFIMNKGDSSIFMHG
ncbi:MAG: hypothetical protein E3J72_14015 [Planctomycetota bacterium]|nr:MAG: hypothetical protein E3J72_14015 [Planctomycetota bacterium]